MIAGRGLQSRASWAAVPLLAASLAVAGLAVPPVAAAGGSIVVTTNVASYENDGACSLVEAIYAANTDAAVFPAAGECPAGSGADTITFGLPSVTVDAYGGLPAIEADLTIDGGGKVTLDIGYLGHLHAAAGAIAFNGLSIIHGGNGGIVVDGTATTTITDTTISGTSAGAGVYNAGTVTLERTTIANNTSSVGPAGLLNTGTATVLDSLIHANLGTSAGGISNTGPLTVRRTTISSNHAATGYGGGIWNASTATVSSSTINGNSAVLGGGVWNQGDLALDNVTIADNTADQAGGGIFASAPVNGLGTLTATNVTITRNGASQGKGVYNGVAVTLRNSILAGNLGPVGAADLDGVALAAGSSHNQVGPLPGGVALSTWLDGGLRDNGGRTATIALVNSSVNPFATAGDPAVCAVAPVAAVDQRGVIRPASACSIGAVQLDRSAPVATAPTVAIRAGSTLSGTAVRALITWTARDNVGGSGVSSFVVQRSRNGGAWSAVATVLTPSYSPLLSIGTAYRFRIVAIDHDGNRSAAATSSSNTPRLTQGTSTALHYTSTWRTASSTAYSGGSTRYATTGGASASYTATGRAYAFVSTKAANRGKARIYVNGVLKATIDLGTMATTYRAQVWSIRYSTSASRTIKVVVVGTSGRPRVDLDAFIVLR
jgi:hypothetical protein